MSDKDLEKEKKIKEAIIEVVVFFDIFSYPLSLMEIWTYLRVTCTYEELSEAIKEMDELELSNGLYHLKGRSELLNIRVRNYNHSNRKFKRALWVTKIFSFVPWIKMVAIVNIIGANNLRDSSDIDFFIVTKKSRIWITRFICSSITKILMLRPKVNDIRDKVCLSFYVSEEAMDLRNLHLDKNDLYFVYWLANLVPIYSNEEFFKEFLQANDWLNDQIPNWQAPKIIDSRRVKYRKMFSYREITDLFFGGLEGFCKKLQLKILPIDIKNLQNKDTRVVLSDEILKLHVNDRRLEFMKIYKKNIKKIYG